MTIFISIILVIIALCVWDIRKLLQKLYEEDAIGFEIESDEDE